MNEGALHAARVLMGDSLGFHIIFVLFGLSLPVLVSWFEWMGIRRGDQRLIDTAKMWSKVMALLVITGVISGTIIALQMSLVWPGILKFGGEVIGLPFMFETYAFLIEAVFLALYMTTWNKKAVSQRLHAVFGLFIILGSVLSAFAITSVNGWMNLPTGFDLVDGKFTNVSVARAMFSQTSLVEFAHSMPAYYFAGSLTVAGLYAYKLLRARRNERSGAAYALDVFIIKRLGLFALVMFVAIGITADITGKYLAKHEPVKLAAIELNYETRSHAPLLIGGVPGPDNTIDGPHIMVPSALSILAGNSPDKVVLGLDQFDKELQPPLVVHTFFDIKMTLITALVPILAALIIMLKWRPEWLYKRWLLICISCSGVMALTIVELGWMITEIGRQPWAVRGYITTEQALTKTHDITSFGYFFPLSYVALFALTILGIRKITREATGDDVSKTSASAHKKGAK